MNAYIKAQDYIAALEAQRDKLIESGNASTEQLELLKLQIGAYKDAATNYRQALSDANQAFAVQQKQLTLAGNEVEKQKGKAKFWRKVAMGALVVGLVAGVVIAK